MEGQRHSLVEGGGEVLIYDGRQDRTENTQNPKHQGPSVKGRGDAQVGRSKSVSAAAFSLPQRSAQSYLTATQNGSVQDHTQEEVRVRGVSDGDDQAVRSGVERPDVGEAALDLRLPASEEGGVTFAAKLAEVQQGRVAAALRGPGDPLLQDQGREQGLDRVEAGSASRGAGVLCSGGGRGGIRRHGDSGECADVRELRHLHDQEEEPSHAGRVLGLSEVPRLQGDLGAGVRWAGSGEGAEGADGQASGDGQACSQGEGLPQAARSWATRWGEWLSGKGEPARWRRNGRQCDEAVCEEARVRLLEHMGCDVHGLGAGANEETCGHHEGGNGGAEGDAGAVREVSSEPWRPSPVDPTVAQARIREGNLIRKRAKRGI